MDATVQLPAESLTSGSEFELVGGAYWYYGNCLMVRYPDDKRPWKICGKWPAMPVVAPGRGQLAFLVPWEFEFTRRVLV